MDNGNKPEVDLTISREGRSLSLVRANIPRLRPPANVVSVAARPEPVWIKPCGLWFVHEKRIGPSFDSDQCCNGALMHYCGEHAHRAGSSLPRWQNFLGDGPALSTRAEPLVSSVAAPFLLGLLLIVSGIVQGISPIDARKVPHFWPSVVLSVIVSVLFLQSRSGHVDLFDRDRRSQNYSEIEEIP